jgi:predicted transcriptional regulator
MVGKVRAERMTREQRAELARSLEVQYQAGASIRELAASTGRSYGFIHRVLTDAGVPMRGRGGATRARAARLAAG